MKAKLMILMLVVAVAVMSAAQSSSRGQSQNPDQSTATATTEPSDPEQENTRGAFLTSRPKATEKPATNSTSTSSQPRSRRRPMTTAKSTTTGSTSTSGNASAKNAGDPSKKKPVVQKIGLGLTLFMRDSNGLAVRVDPTHEFHNGDRVRVLLETNTDGHLYIFNTTDDGPPVMIYPDPQLDEAGNYLQAHVPLEIPSSVATEENLRWFRFNEQKGIERLYCVFTREPLGGVPIEDDLLKYCGEGKTQCTWHPSAELWARLQKQFSTPTPVARAQNYGTPQTGAEHQAATRGIGLATTDPEPSLVMMNASSSTALLVAALDLFHR